MLLVGAGLLIRSFVRLEHVPPGFNPQHVISMEMTLSGQRYLNNDEAVSETYRLIEDGVKRLPGVLSLVLRQGAKLVAAGTMLGTIGALLSSRAMESMLFGVSPNDSGTFCAVILILCLA